MEDNIESSPEENTMYLQLLFDNIEYCLHEESNGVYHIKNLARVVFVDWMEYNIREAIKHY